MEAARLAGWCGNDLNGDVFGKGGGGVFSLFDVSSMFGRR